MQMNIKMKGLRNLNFSSLPKYMHTIDLYSAVLCEEKVLFIHLLRIDSEFSKKNSEKSINLDSLW